MRRISVLVGSSLVLGILWLTPASASAAFTQCPPVYEDTGCQFLITIGNGESTIASDSTQGPYEGADDALIGVVNSSSQTVSSIPLSAETELFGFEEDGICSPGGPPLPEGCKVLPREKEGNATAKASEECAYAGETKGGVEVSEEVQEACGFEPPEGEPTGLTFPEGISINGFATNGNPVTGYEGPRTWYTGIVAPGFQSGVINFYPPLAPGESTYFSLESPPVSGFGLITTLSTTLSGGGQSGASITVVQGTAVTDAATLSGLNATTAGGTVTFNVYSDPECKNLVTAAGSAKMSGGSAGPSSAETLAPGKYYWQANYGGDINNQPAASACETEALTVLATTTTTTVQSGAGVSGSSLTTPVGTSVTDQAHIAGSLAAGATGTVTYALFKDKKCTKAATRSSSVSVVGGAAGPSAAVKPKVGTYYWQATYSGDGANAGSTSTCGGEILVVAKKASLLPSIKVCLSKRKFIAHPRAPKGVKLVRVEVLINGKLKHKGKLVKHHTTINLIGLPKGKFKVTMVVTSSKGQKYADIRTYHTCVPGKHKHKHKKKK
jgi:hypothetical protein